MPLLLTEAPAVAGMEGLRHKTWTREELAVLESLDLFSDSNFELVEGELIDKMGKNWPHVVATRKLVQVLSAIFGVDSVFQEAPMDVSAADNTRNRPEPDVLVLQDGVRLQRSPRADEVRLVAEVSDSTIGLDRNTKAALYARAGISEYWIVDLNRRRLFVLREPLQGRYTSETEFSEDAFVAPPAAPQHRIPVSSLLPE